MSSKSSITTFEGHRNLRIRLILATLAGKPIKIVKIRSDDMNPGLKDYEVSFLRLLESVTNGSQIEISYTGTTIIYRPGIVIGGELTHNCPPSKPVGYFIEPMLYLAPFSKKKFSIVFKGLTALSGNDAGVEAIKWGLLPIMEKFGVREVSLHILKRGSPPLGGGEVHLLCNSLIANPLTLHATETPKFSAIRGVAYCTRVSPSTVNRMIDSARDVLRPSGVEVNITADVWRGENSGKSPGFGVTLVAESKKGWRVLAEGVGSAGSLPEELGEKVALQLLHELSNSSVVGRNQILMCLSYMVIGKEDIGRLKLHKSQIDENFIWWLRDIRAIFGTEVYLKDLAEEPIPEDEEYMMASIKGIGFTSASKKIV
ncbi:RNA 3'-terminal phosphate cyclase-like protein [[Candida] railenensis]|uniref:RNA 3'-terminal phosphate cyclase-like protein n=1 Tax=[Candida] railenensis TaxID=45579 RepID=A0A9P0QUP4_9ASCO|nr:RNA 3'-terminal phosphate cyclase-like protein [[Candida] railenensis]